jgi:hypothetical protein
MRKSDDASGWGTDPAFPWRGLGLVAALWLALLIAIVRWGV